MENKIQLNPLDTVEEKSDCSSDQKLSKFNKYVYTALLCYANLTYGASLTCMTPALTDFKSLLQQSTETISHYFTLFAVGTILGSMFGFLFKYINRQLTLVIILILFGSATVYSPFCTNFIIFYLCGFISGLGAGTLDTVQTVWLIEMWDQNSGSILQLSECTYGIGTFIGPLIVQPFVTGDTDAEHHSEHQTATHSINPMTPNFYYNNNNSNSNINETIDYRKNLTTPFSISGSAQLLGALLLLIMYFFHKYTPLAKTEEEIEKEIEEVLRPIEKIYHRRYSVQILEERPASLSDNHMKPRFSIQVNNVKNFENINQSVVPIKRRFSSFHQDSQKLYKPPRKLPRKTVLGIGAVAFATVIASEMAYVDFSPTYFQYAKKFSGSQSALLLSAMTASYTLTRAVSIFIAIKVRPKYMLYCHYFIVFCAFLILYLSGSSDIAIWFGSIVYGIGIATFWSATFSHIEHYFEITDRVGTIYISSLGFIQGVTQFIEGPLIEKYPIVVLYYCTLCTLISLLCFLSIRFIVWRTKTKPKSNNDFNQNTVTKI